MWDHAPVLILCFNYRPEVIPGYGAWPKKQQGSAKGCLGPGSQEYMPVPGKPYHAKPVPISLLRPGTGCAREKKNKDICAKHKPQVLVAGLQDDIPACMPRLVTGKARIAGH